MRKPKRSKAHKRRFGPDPAKLLVPASKVHYDLKAPCGDCPFLKTSPYHQGTAESLPLYMETLNAGQFCHTCHKTDTRPECDGPVAGKQTDQPLQHCVGALLMVLKSERYDLQLPLLRAAEKGLIDLTALTAQAKADKRVFTVNQLIRFYTTEIERRLPELIAEAQAREAKGAETT